MELGTELLLLLLAESLAHEIVSKEAGHCLRVDHLTTDSATFLSAAIEERTGDCRCYVLTAKEQRTLGRNELNTERAIELRNRKPQAFILLIPSGLTDSTASSLRNAFAAFDLDRFWLETRKTLISKMPDDVKDFAEKAISISRLPGLSEEDRATYCASIASAVDKVKTAANQCYRIGLVPSSDLDIERLESNARAAKEIARPVRSHSSLPNRLDAVGVQPGKRRQVLESFLEQYQLSDWRTWMRAIAAHSSDELKFSAWDLITRSQSQLKRLTITPWLNADGDVNKWSKLRQSEPGTQPFATVEPKGEVQLRWESDPIRPEGLDKWRIEMIPSQDFYAASEIPDVSLPSKNVKGTLKSSSLKLSAIDWPEDTSSIVVQLRLTAISELGAELTDGDDKTFEAISEEIQLRPPLEMDGGAGVGSSSNASRTSRDLPLAKLRIAVDTMAPKLEVASCHWSGTQENVFNLTVESGARIRISFSPVLKKLEASSISKPETLGTWEIDVVSGSTVVPEKLVTQSTKVSSELGKQFIKARSDFFRQIASQGIRRWLAIVDWNSNLMRSAEEYVGSYQDWLRGASHDERRLALSIDSGVVHLRSDARTIAASITSPLHPMHVAWFMQYHATFDQLTAALLETSDSPSERRDKLDINSLELIEPSGCPMLTTAVDGQIRLTAGCLDFLWTVALPIDWPDPARAVSLISRTLGVPTDDQSINTTLVSRCASHVQNYLKLHRHAQKLRIVTDNAGDGEFSAKLLCNAVERLASDQSELGESAEDLEIESVELLAHFRSPIPSALPGIGPLRQLLEQRGGNQASSCLQPLLETAIRPSESLTEIHNGGSHLTVLMDITSVKLRTGNGIIGRGTAAFNGLLSPIRLLLEGPPWRYCVSEAGDGDSLTPVLLTHQSALAASIDGSDYSDDRLPILEVAIEGDASRLSTIHAQSDWVMTLDRFIEPAWIESNAGMRYLLDYSPDISDGLTRRLFLTTGHRDEASQIIAETLNELGFNCSDDAVTNVLNRLRQVSGRLALNSIGSGKTQREATALAIALERLEAYGKLNDAIIVPVDSHIEMFTPFRRKGRPEKGRRCDLLLVRRIQSDVIEMELVEVKGRAHRPSPDVFATIREQLSSTEQLIQSLWCSPDRYDRPLQLFRLRQILEHHLRRAYGFGTVTKLDCWHETLERLANGFVRIQMRLMGFVVCSSAMPETIRKGNIDIEVIGDFSWPKRPIAEPASPVSAAFTTSERGQSRKPSNSHTTDSPVERNPQPILSQANDKDDLEASSASARDPNEAVSDLASAPSVVVQPVTPATNARSPFDSFIKQPSDLRDSIQPNPNKSTGSLFDRIKFAVEPTVQADGMPELPKVSISNLALPDAVSTEKPKIEASASPNEATAEPIRETQDGEIAVILGDGPTGPTFWRPAVSGSPHLFVIGIPGQGKSVTTTRLLCELTKHSIPALVLDFHGEFSNPDGPYHKLARPSILNAADGLPFSILEPKQGKGPRAKESIWELAEICQYVCGLGDIQRDSLYRAFESVYETIGPNETPLLSSVSEFLEEDEDEGNAKNVIARCRPLFEFGLFADVPTEGIYEQFTKGAVVDLHELKSEALQLAAGAFTLRKLYRAMFTWGTADRIRLVIVLDEAHRLAKDVTLPKIMKEGRKFGIAVVVASQDVRDFHEQVLSNAGTKVIFRVNYPDSRKVSGFVRATGGDTLSQQIERLSVGEAIIQTPEMPAAQHVRMRRVGS